MTRRGRWSLANSERNIGEEVRASKVCKGSGGWRSTDWQGWHFGGRDVRLLRSRPTSRRTTLWCMPRAHCCMLFERKNTVVARAVCCCCGFRVERRFALSVSRPDQMSTCIQFRNFLIKPIRLIYFFRCRLIPLALVADTELNEIWVERIKISSFFLCRSLFLLSPISRNYWKIIFNGVFKIHLFSRKLFLEKGLAIIL